MNFLSRRQELEENGRSKVFAVTNVVACSNKPDYNFDDCSVASVRFMQAEISCVNYFPQRQSVNLCHSS